MDNFVHQFSTGDLPTIYNKSISEKANLLSSVNAKHQYALSLFPSFPSRPNPTLIINKTNHQPKRSTLRSLRRPIHTHIPTLKLVQILEHKTPLEISVRMRNRIQFTLRPQRSILDFFNLVFMLVFKDTVASDVETCFCDIFLDGFEDFAVGDAGGLEESHEIVLAEPAVGASVGLTAAGYIRDEFLAGVRCVASAAAVGVAADVAVGVTDVVKVFLFELVVGDEFEAFAPEGDAFVHVEADAFEKERVLQSGEVLQVAVFA
jgi:hypothetical protein